jgi:hypothetical protein
MKFAKVFGWLTLGMVVSCVLVNLNDIRRYIRITTM